MAELRLQKYFSECGVLSRRAAEAEIAAGRVLVNGLPALPGTKIDPASDLVEWNGKRIAPPAKQVGHTYVMLHKPVGYVTTMKDERGRPTAASLLSSLDVRVYPVGRLDMYSDGLLLFTDDGELANRMMHPSHHVRKQYLLTLKGTLTEEDAHRYEEPMRLDGYAIRPVRARLLSSGFTLPDGVVASTVEITLWEGRNRQIRRMSEQLGYTVIRLRRIAVGEIRLDLRTPGQWRYLTEEEIRYLHSIT